MRDDANMERATSDATSGTVYWVTGLAGAGKTTLARRLVDRLRTEGRRVVFLDGNELRERLFPDVGFSGEERRGLARRYGELCALFSGQGTDVVCATISMAPEVWAWNRAHLSPYCEVFVRAPLDVRQARKGEVYEDGDGSVVGRETPVSEPPDAHVAIVNDGSRSIDAVFEELWLAVERSESVPVHAEAIGTKAEALAYLSSRLEAARVLPQVRFTVGEWHADADAQLAQIVSEPWASDALIARSSALDEDVVGSSQAGRYTSAGPCAASELRAAVDQVARSLASRDEHQIFVQPFLTDVQMSGVALTRDPASGAHYTIVSYDETSGRTDSITSGRAEERRTYYHHEQAPALPTGSLGRVLKLTLELQEHLGRGALDVEFAIDREGHLVLLQVRRLGDEVADAASGMLELGSLARVAARIRALSADHPYLYGTRAVFGTMPDWNPAEVIGVRPRPLAKSLYKELVTDSIWAYQRHNYGYRNLRSFPLLVSFGGLPYIDVRVSFNSFLPADLDEDLGRRLVDHYIDRLLAAPIEHDKIEFSIVYSSYTLDLPDRMAELEHRGFSRLDCERLSASLRTLTNRITADPQGPFRVDLGKIAELERRQAAFAETGRTMDPVSRMYWLLEDCKRYGTLPFAGIARAAFIGVQLLDSLVTTSILTPEDRDAFLRSLHTVRGSMAADYERLERSEFLERYGHLRPGTYDITSLRYDEAPEAYFAGADATREGAPSSAFTLTREAAAELDRRLRQHGLEHDSASLLGFLREAIEGREYAKFVFTRSLSDLLVTLSELGEGLGFSRNDLSYADIGLLSRLYSGSDDVRVALGESIEAGRRRFDVTRRLTLPPLVSSPDDVFSFHLPECAPNYVTLERAEGPVVTVDEGTSDLRGSIVMIQSADPGHDWIFSHAVAGFVTMYGGYNSHMAIRAGELGIPAVIGAGEALFRAWSSARTLRLDCMNQRVEVIS